MKKIIIAGVLLSIFYVVQAMEEGACSIKGLDKVEVLRALHEKAKPLKMGHIALDFYTLNRWEAENSLAWALEMNGGFLGELKGRCMNVDLSGDKFSTHAYNKGAGENQAEKVIKKLRKETQKKSRPGESKEAKIKEKEEVRFRMQDKHCRYLLDFARECCQYNENLGVHMMHIFNWQVSINSLKDLSKEDFLTFAIARAQFHK